MPFDPEAITSPGSGLVFLNYYDASVGSDYRNAIINAEHELQAHFTNPVTIVANFDLAPLAAQVGGSLSVSLVSLSYSTLRAALQNAATTSDDFLAVNGLPAVDPSNGAGFSIPVSQARALGLLPQTNSVDLHISLNSGANWSFGTDAVGVIEKELAEGAFGRLASLGFQAPTWRPMDLFRFADNGTRDFTGGADGVLTHFGLDSTHLTSFVFHNGVNAGHVYDGSDMADWEGTTGDAFGPSGPGAPGVLSGTDLRVLDILGWNAAPYLPPSDDFANNQSDGSRSIGPLSPGGSSGGALQYAGDRDWFRIQLQAGLTYTFSLASNAGASPGLADPYLRIHDGQGNVLAFNDDSPNGGTANSLITFTAPSSDTFFIDAGAFADAYTGAYTISASQGVLATGSVLQAGAGNTTVVGGPGNDTISGWSGGDVLRGSDGNDSIVGGSGFDDINGNKGDDTITDNSGGDDWLVGGQGNDQISAQVGGNILYGNLGNDTLHGGAGAEIVRGGQGDDSITGGGGNDFISGDRGNDTESGGSGADLFHTFSGAGIDRVLDFSLAEGDRVMLDPGTTFTVTQVGSDTVINMGNGDQMILVGVQMSTLTGAWIFGA